MNGFVRRALSAALLVPLFIASCGGTSEREIPVCRNAWREIRIPDEFSQLHAGAAAWLDGRLYVFAAPEPGSLPDAAVGLVFEPPDQFYAIANEGAPTSVTQLIAAVPVGREIVVLARIGGGCRDYPERSCFGGRYDVDADTWRPIPPFPEGSRTIELVVPMGDEIFTAERVVTGANPPVGTTQYHAYGLATDGWARLSDRSDPGLIPIGVWTGDEVILWGPSSPEPGAPGARYRRSEDSWLAISQVNAPPESALPRVWTGSEAIMWEGPSAEGTLSAGGRYYADGDAWAPMDQTGAPQGSGNRAIAVGRRMILLGLSQTGTRWERVAGVYDAELDSWGPLPSRCGPDARLNPELAWTGDGLIVWGGSSEDCLSSVPEDCPERAWYLPSGAVFGELAGDSTGCSCPPPLGAE